MLLDPLLCGGWVLRRLTLYLGLDLHWSWAHHPRRVGGDEVHRPRQRRLDLQTWLLKPDINHSPHALFGFRLPVQSIRLPHPTGGNNWETWNASSVSESLTFVCFLIYNLIIQFPGSIVIITVFTIIIVAKRGFTLGNWPIYDLYRKKIASWCNCDWLARVIQLYLPEFKIYFELELLILETLPKLSATPISYYFQVLTQVNQLKQTKIKPFVSSDFHYFAYYMPLNHCTVGLGKARQGIFICIAHFIHVAIQCASHKRKMKKKMNK